MGDGGLGELSREPFGSLAAAVVAVDPFDRGAIACEEGLGPAPKRLCPSSLAVSKRIFGSLSDFGVDVVEGKVVSEPRWVSGISFYGQVSASRGEGRSDDDAVTDVSAKIPHGHPRLEQIR